VDEIAVEFLLANLQAGNKVEFSFSQRRGRAAAVAKRGTWRVAESLAGHSGVLFFDCGVREFV
jgi:hypothetical protein